MNNTPLTDSLFPSHIEPVNLEVGQLLIKARKLCSELEQQSKSLSHYSSEELFNELRNRKEDLEFLDIRTKTSYGITVKDLVFLYTVDKKWPPKEFLLFAPHLKKTHQLEFLYNHVNGIELLRDFVPSFLQETEEGIYDTSLMETLCIDLLKKCGIECQRNDEWFDY